MELADIDESAFDIVVIGGGANGAAAAERLSRERYSVLLVDRSDFGSGTSSRSSRMLHCGFRSLEGMAGMSLLQGFRERKKLLAAIRGAREQLHARADFVASFPERCKPVTIVMPIFAGGVAGYQMDMAAILLAALGRKGVPLEYRRRHRAHLAGLPYSEWLENRPELRGTVSFRDYVFDWPERVCIDLALRAQDSGAAIRNYTAVVALEARRDGGFELRLRDQSSGAEATVVSQLVLNLAGPWVDEVLGLASRRLPPQLSASKGTQIAIKLPDRYADHGIVANTREGAFVCIPTRGLHIIGATKSKFDGDPGEVTATEAEIEDLINRANTLLPGIGLDRSSVRYAIAGVRPGAVGTSGRAIVDHAADGFEGMYTVTGGTLGTSRMTAERLSVLVAGKLGASASRPEVRMAQDRTDGARSLSDIAFRRTGEAWGADFSTATAEKLANALGHEMGWSEAETMAELRRFRRQLSHNCKREIC